MSHVRLAFTSAAVVLCLSGCSSLLTASDDSILQNTAGALGTAVGDVTITNKSAQGMNVYYTAKVKAGAEYACNMTAGGALSFGMGSPPNCVKKEDGKATSSSGCNAMLRAAGHCK